MRWKADRDRTARATAFSRLSRTDVLQGVQLLSLDVFDTALIRLVHRPTDVFQVVERALVERHGTILLGFSRSRCAAEVGARAVLAAHGVARQVRLDDIYDWLVSQRPAWGPHRSAMKDAELAAEATLLAANPAILSLYQRATHAGIPTVFLSDMYLTSEFIATQLARRGFGADAAVYVSAERGSTKYDGGLFDLMLSERTVPPDQVLHVGDCPISDGTRPGLRGIRSVVIPAGRHLLEHEAGWRVIDATPDRGEPAVGVLLGIQAAALLRGHPSVATGVGFQVFGPMLVGFTQWLLEAARARGIRRVYFLSRDGWILQRAYETITSGTHDCPAAAYLLTSRRALMLASLRDFDPDVMQVLSGFSAGTTLRSWLRSFEIHGEDHANALQRHGFESPDDVLGDASRKRVSQLLLELGAEVRHHASGCRAGYLKYLEESGILASDVVALVDSGWTGTIQKACTDLLSDAGSRTRLVGLYLGLRDVAARKLGPKETALGYLFHLKSHDHSWQFQQEARLIEAFCGAPQRALLAMRLVDGSAVPVHEVTDPEQLDPIVEELQRGAIAFVEQYRAVAPHTAGVLPASFVRKIIERLVLTPTKQEAMVLGAIGYSAWIGVGAESVLARPKLGSWGLVSPARLLRDYKASSWRSGYMAQLGWARRAMIRMSDPTTWRSGGVPSRLRSLARRIYRRAKRGP